MIILHVITTIDRGGAENHLRDLIREQVNRGHTVSVAYLKGTGYWRASFEALGVRVYPLCLHIYGDPGPVVKLRRIIEKMQPDVVHSHMPPADLYTCIALSMLGRRSAFIITKHNDEPFYNGWGSSIVSRLVYSRTNKIIAISEAVRKYITNQQIGSFRNRTLTIPYGIETAPFDTLSNKYALQLREEWGIGKNELLIGTIARLAPQKALHILLQGFSQYLIHTEHEARLVIVGKGPLEQKLRLLSHRLGISERVIWAGFREDIPAVLNAYDVFVLTSRYEGFGLVLLEAMAAAKPIVATRVSAIPEVVTDGETAILIPPNDVNGLVKALLFFQDENQRSAFGNAGALRARNNFSLNLMVERTLSVYEEVFCNSKI